MSEVEHAMLVSAQTDRTVLGKNAPYCKSKRCNNPLDAVVNEVISCGQDYSFIAFENCRLVFPLTFRVKAP